MAGSDVASSNSRSSGRYCCGVRGVRVTLRLCLASTRCGHINLRWLARLDPLGRVLYGWVGAEHHLQRVRSAIADRTALPPSGRRSPAPASASHEVTPVGRQQCMLTTARPHRRASPRLEFRARVPILFRCEGGFAGSAHLIPPLIPFRLASHHNTRPELLRRSQTWLWHIG